MMKTPNPRRSQRGAIFVEAIVVLSFSILCFLGVIYFRELYVGKMRVQRLARASAMAHAMGACKGDPAAGLEADLPKKPLSRDRKPGTPHDLKLGTDKGGEALSKLGRTSGGTPMNEITTITLSTSAAATTRKDQLSEAKGFETKNLGATSYVTCGDEVSDGQYVEIIPRIVSIFGEFF